VPRRDDIETILLLGSGPIVIGQASEFDYSGTQACRVLRSEGYRVVLANSNPATIMTDPEFADRTYVEPLDLEVLTAIIERERPDAVLPTLGGQTALNLAMQLEEAGVLERFGVELIGASAEAIATAENRQRFKEAMQEIGLAVPELGHGPHPRGGGRGLEVGRAAVHHPARLHPRRAGHRHGRHARGAAPGGGGRPRRQPISEILIERSIAGWKEYELEVMRDHADNCVIVCSIENLDPMGVHTGDSVTVAPAQTLSDVEYQLMRDAAFACIRRVGVETGGSNVQFALDPETGDMVVIEMNPRVSRSSALASKATGFPIAKIAARLAVGYTLDEITNDITGVTPASFEPTIDYVVTKIPRWAFEKFPGSPGVLGTSMQSVGEAMAIGRTFPESLQKALRSLETGPPRAQLRPGRGGRPTPRRRRARAPGGDRHPRPAVPARGRAAPRHLRRAPLRRHPRRPVVPRPDLAIVEERAHLAVTGLAGMDRAAGGGPSGSASPTPSWRGCGASRGRRAPRPEASRCAAHVQDGRHLRREFEAKTPYHYSTWEDEDEARPSGRPTIAILGSGPNRIGQGIEFDYCCVHASFALREAGFDTVMVNCNPETVSTDYDTSDRLYFEPLTPRTCATCSTAEALRRPPGRHRHPRRPDPAEAGGVLPPGLVLGTVADMIDLAEDRERWNALCASLGIPQPAGAPPPPRRRRLAITAGIGYPALVRPSYVLGGRADVDRLRRRRPAPGDGRARRLRRRRRPRRLPRAEGGLSAERPGPRRPLPRGRHEVDVDAVRDATGEVLIGGVMEHVEEAGVHSGDSACAIPRPRWPTSSSP
jgi:carbamoyl-phosphate synthase large subunit